ITDKHKIRHVLIMLADQPFVKTEYLSRLIKIYESNKNKIIVSNYKSSFGVPAVFGENYFSDLIGLYGEKGAKKIIYKYENSIEVADFENNLLDIDKKKEYKDLIYSVDTDLAIKNIKKS
ncbi:NTP transferase domain-containing protein, partial [Bacteroidota bacterium]